MPQLDEKSIKYRELFAVVRHPAPTTEPEISVGITDNGELIRIYEFFFCVSAAWGSERKIYSLSKQEYRELLKSAMDEGYLQIAIDRGDTTLEEAERLGRE